MLTVTVIMMMTTMMVMMLLNIVMNKTVVALGSTERIDGIRRQVSRLSDHARLIRLSFGYASESES